MRILEEFWYGNIEPTEYDTSSCKEYKKLLELICRNEEIAYHKWKKIISNRNWLLCSLMSSEKSLD